MNWFRTQLITAAMLVALENGTGVTPVATAEAQDYSFGVPKLQMHVVVNPDASAKIVYDITFNNNPGAHVIDVVDIGVPHEKYKLGNVLASVEGTPLSDIRHSEYVKPGFEVHLKGKSIRAGGSGTFHCEFTMPDMVFQDTTRDDYASLRITPTWFGSQFVRGTTDVDLAIHLPAGVKPDEALHHGEPFTKKAVTLPSVGRSDAPPNGRGTSVVWQWRGTRLTGPHMVGVSFPKRDLQRVVKTTKLDLLLKWFSESPRARLVAGLIFLVLFGIVFFRFTGGTGVSVFVVLSGLAILLFYVSPGWHLLSLPIVAVLLGVNEWFLHKRKARYMPPIAQVEGGGIKRGLTAPEAAALLELPVSRVLGLVIFGMLKKGILCQVQTDPLVVEVDDAFRITEGQLLTSETERAKFYRQVGQKKGIVVHKYEHPFIYLLQENPGKPAAQINFAAPMKQLISRVASRMKGFDVSDTQEYYRSICRRAVEQASAIGDIPQREKRIDRNFEWILIDDDYPTVFTYGRPYRPVWVRTATGPSTPSTPSAGPSIPGKTTFGDVSASFAGWAENTMGNMASAIAPGSLSAPRASGGFINLGGFDRVTGEFFQALAESSSSGGGGGGGGCACAGCACACACAGGGR